MAAEAVAVNFPTDPWSTFEQTAMADLLQWVPKNADADFHVWKVQHAMDFVRSMYESGDIKPSFIRTAYGTTEPQGNDPTGIAYLIKKIVSDVYTFDPSMAQDSELIAEFVGPRLAQLLLAPMRMEEANARIQTPEGHFPLLPFAIGSYARQPEAPVVYDIRSQNSFCFIGNRQDRVNAMKRIVQSARYMNPTEALQLITVQDEKAIEDVHESFMRHDQTFTSSDFRSVMDMVEANGRRSNGHTHLLFIADSVEQCFARSDYSDASQELARLSQLQEEGVSITWMLGMNQEFYSYLLRPAVYVSSQSVLFPYNGLTHIFRGISDHTPREAAIHSEALMRELQEIPAGAYIHEPHYFNSLYNVDSMWPLGGGQI